jgi:NADPH:quinone reductase
MVVSSWTPSRGELVHAIMVREFGGPEKLQLVELPDPQPGPGEVLVAVAAAGVNRADALARSGGYHRAGKPPLLLGLEGAGTVAGVGPGVTQLRIGQRVVALGATNDPGFYAEFAVVPAAMVVPVPDDVELTEAAALPTAWLTAWYCLRRLADLQSGETVLIHAAASGVGSAAVQIAIDAGATVIGTARSSGKTSWARELGATAVLDTSAMDSGTMIEDVRRLTSGRGADVVLDTVGGQTFAVSLRAAAYAARVVSLANVALAPSTIDTRDFYPKNIRILGFQITALIEHGYDPRPDLRELLDGIGSGRFSVPVDVTFPLVQAEQAHRRLEARANRGKVLLTIP